MIWRRTVATFIHVLVLNAWLANERPEIQPEVEWKPPVVDQDGEVRQ